MKSAITFVAGAVLASGLVFLLMKKDGTTPEPVAVSQSVAPVPSGVPESPTPAAAPEPQSQFAPEPKPSALPRVATAKRAPAKTEPRLPATPAPASSPAPAAQPAQPAQPSQPEQPSQPAPEPVRAPEPKLPPPPPPQPKTVTIPAGTLVAIRVDETLRSDRNQSGDSFKATLDQPLVVDGFVIAERGARVEGRVIEVDQGGRVKGLSQMSLELVRLNTSDGQRVRLQTESFARQGEKDTKKDIAKIGAAAGIGAAIGAIAGGGKGAAIGAGVGGAAGAGGVMATRGKPAEIPAETRLSFRLREPITITEKL